MTLLGNQMVGTGLLDVAQLDLALARQRDQGGYLGQHLVDAGFITREQLQDALAQQWQVERRDLDADPPLAGLLDRRELRRVIELGWLPCEVVGGSHVVVATSVPPGPDLVEEVVERFPGLAVSFVACTRRDLDRFAVGLAGGREVPVATASRRKLCPPPIVRDVVGGAALVVALTWLLAARPALLAATVLTLGALFLALVVVQVGAAVWSAARRPATAPAAAAAPTPDVLLPVYSVLVPVSGGADTLRRVVADVAALDYPASRLDVVLLVPEDDRATRVAVRAQAPPSFVRVAAIDPAMFADPVLVLDTGLALAHGRYVVALAPDEVPEPGQLRHAVQAFEADLEENLAVRRGRAPLTALRVGCRQWRSAGSFASGTELVEDVSGFTRAFPWQGPGTDLRADLTTTHCNTAVLRRLGGWGAIRTPGGGGEARMRVAVLASTTLTRRRAPLGTLLTRRAEEVARELRIATERARRFRLTPDVVPPRITDIVLGFAAPLLLLVHPVALVAGTCLLLRFEELDPGSEHFGLLGLAAVASAMGLAILAGLAVARKRGRRALGHVLALPAHWLVRAVAAWYAVLVLLPCRPPSHGSSTHPQPYGAPVR